MFKRASSTQLLEQRATDFKWHDQEFEYKLDLFFVKFKLDWSEDAMRNSFVLFFIHIAQVYKLEVAVGI